MGVSTSEILIGKGKSPEEIGAWNSSNGRDFDRMDGETESINAEGIKAPSLPVRTIFPYWQSGLGSETKRGR